jgi:group I intron endonuclease
MWYIYCVTNIINNKSYVGLSSNVEERWKNHVRDSLKKDGARYFAFQAAINKYGKDSFTWDVLESHSTLEEANQAEDFYISYFNTIAPNGYNLSSGGGSHLVHQTTKKKISETLKTTSSLIGKCGPKHYLYGKKISDATKDKTRLKISGENGPNTKLTEAEVIFIYNLGLKGLNTTEVQEKLMKDIGQVAILNIFHKKSWKKTLELFPPIDFSFIKRKDPPPKPKPIIRFPKFTKEQLEIISTSPLSSSKLAAILGCNAGSIRKARQRLRKAIQLANQI